MEGGATVIGRVWGVFGAAVVAALMVAGGGGLARADDLVGRSGVAAGALPPGVVAVDRQRLLGRWVPVSGSGAHSPRPPFLELRADGRWTGSDGCNGQGGTWSVAGDGGFRATAGPSTMMACDGEPIGAWMSHAAGAGLLGDELVLVDKAGVEQGRLRRG